MLAYRLAALACGFGSIAMGYRLFRLGIFERAGDLKANWGERSLLLKAAAPGTFFALFGSAIIAVTLWRGFTIETSRPIGDAGTVALASGRPGLSPEFQEALGALAAGRPLTDDQRNLLASRIGIVEKRTIQGR